MDIDLINQAHYMKEKYLLSVKQGTHEQFYLDKNEECVKCKCGTKAVWIRTGYMCGSVTAYPCDYNKK